MTTPTRRALFETAFGTAAPAWRTDAIVGLWLPGDRAQSRSHHHPVSPRSGEIGKLVGFSAPGGVELKLRLLTIEGALRACLFPGLPLARRPA